MKGIGYVGAFIGGALVGAAVGLLTAPEKGKDTRAKLANSVNGFLKKHNIKMNRKDVDDLVDDLEIAND
jgi:gas vesicle protein